MRVALAYLGVIGQLILTGFGFHSVSGSETSAGNGALLLAAPVFLVTPLVMTLPLSVGSIL